MQELVINSKDKEFLDKFFKRAEKIQNSRYYKSESRKLSLGVSQNEGIIKMLGPDEDNLYAITALVRPFLLVDQGINLKNGLKKLSSLAKQTNNENYTNCVESYKQGFQQSLKKWGVTINVNGLTFSPEELLDLYIYGEYGKVDIKKGKIIEEMGSFEPIFRFYFISVLDNIIQIILRSANIYHLLKKDYTFKVYATDQNHSQSKEVTLK